MALWLACAGGAKRVPWSLALTSTTLRGLPVQEQAAAGPAKGKGGALKEPKHLCQGTFHLLSNSGDGQTEERRRGCSPSVPWEENQSSLSEG